MNVRELEDTLFNLAQLEIAEHKKQREMLTNFAKEELRILGVKPTIEKEKPK